MSRNVHVAGTGSFAPETVLDNRHFDRILGENVGDWLSEKLTIRQRHVCAEDESAADLATEAGRKALESAGVRPEQIDLIIVATDTPEYVSPATAAVVQHRLGAKNAPNFDLNCACAGFVTALDAASKFLKADDAYRRALVIGVYAMSKYLDWTDKYTCTLFADGAGAVVLEASDRPGGLLASQLFADGSYHDYMGIYAGGSRFPVTRERLERGDHLLRFLKKFPPETNSVHWPRLVRGVAQKAGVEVSDIDFLIFTQININTIREVMGQLGLGMERTHCIMDRYGYTGSACVPMALDEACRQGKIRRDDRVCLVASGGGMSMGSVLLRW